MPHEMRGGAVLSGGRGGVKGCGGARPSLPSNPCLTDPVACEEVLYIWVVPHGGEAKFMQIDVTRQYNLPSLQPLVLQARGAMEQTSAAPAWREPLQQLYDFLIYPVIDFCNANGGYNSTETVLTVMPDAYLWMVPFGALVNGSGEFLIEKFAVATTLSTTVMAYQVSRLTRPQGWIY